MFTHTASSREFGDFRKLPGAFSPNVSRKSYNGGRKNRLLCRTKALELSVPVGKEHPVLACMDKYKPSGVCKRSWVSKPNDEHDGHGKKRSIPGTATQTRLSFVNPWDSLKRL